MSIASRIEAMEGHIGNAYKSLENLGVDLTNVDKNIDNISTELDNLYEELPKVESEGSEISLNGTRSGKLSIIPKGNTEQDTIAYVDVGTWEQGTINASGVNQNSDYWIRAKEFISVKPNILYNISRTIATNYMAFWFYDANKTFIGTNETSGLITTNLPGKQNRMRDGDTSIQVTINNTSVAYMRMADASNDLNTKYTISTQAPNPDYPQSIRNVTGENSVVVSNKNLLPFTNQDFTVNNVRYYVQNGNLYINGTSSGETSPTNANFKNNFKFTLSAGTYTIIGNSQFATYLRKASDDSNMFTNPTYIAGTSRQFTLNEQTELYIGFYAYNNTLNNLDMRLMLEKGSTSTDYIAHAEQTYPINLGNIELCKIGDYQDYITGTKDNWKVVKNIGKVVLNGSEDWAYFWATNGIFVNRNADIISDVNAINGISNRFTTTTRTNIRNNLTTVDNLIAFNQNELVIAYKTIQTIADFKTWLVSNNVTCYYILATSTETPITDTTLINQLNNLYENAKSYNEQTNISSTYASGNAQMIISASSLKGV